MFSITNIVVTICHYMGSSWIVFSSINWLSDSICMWYDVPSVCDRLFLIIWFLIKSSNSIKDLAPTKLVWLEMCSRILCLTIHWRECKFVVIAKKKDDKQCVNTELQPYHRHKTHPLFAYSISPHRGLTRSNQILLCVHIRK